MQVCAKLVMRTCPFSVRRGLLASESFSMWLLMSSCQAKVMARTLHAVRAVGFLFLALVLLSACDRATDAPMPCPKPSFTLIPPVDTLTVGATLQLVAPASTPAPTWQRRLAWSSSASTSVRVDSTGLATAVAPGTAEVTALDLGSPPTCPDVWVGVLIVR